MEKCALCGSRVIAISDIIEDESSDKLICSSPGCTYYLEGKELEC